MLPPNWSEIAYAAWALTSLGLAVGYVFTVEKYRTGWRQLPDWTPSPRFFPSVKISVIIPARNEAANLPDCLASIAKQTYPTSLFEVILLDDHSEDETFLLAQNFAQNHPNVRVVSLADFNVTSKKKAIETGITLATGELIVCTDADCLLPPDWLWHMAAFFEEKQAKFIAAPVNFHQEENWLQRFQSLDFLGMMGVTGAGFQSGSGLLCNGANLAYPKAVFQQVGGFEGISGLASGDDMLLLHKVAKQYPSGVFFLKNRAATVLTTAQPDLRSFISQRLRWASKSRNYSDWRVTLRLGVVFLLCWAIVLNLVSTGWLGWPAALLAVGLFLAKTVVDFRFLGELCRYFGRQDLMRHYLLSQLLHIAYILGIGTLTNVVRRYEWKGRRVR
ncbi:MAG: glycosyltransferase [Bacteroidales bacterium]|nr:glycosyltransferase [Bacteroidales bacterium]MCF8311983.1 glycosyltransferase [Saprospiraceae bacterium]